MYTIFFFTEEGVNFKEDVLKAMDGYFLNTPDGQGEACLWRICLRYYRVVLGRGFLIFKGLFQDPLDQY